MIDGNWRVGGAGLMWGIEEETCRLLPCNPAGYCVDDCNSVEEMYSCALLCNRYYPFSWPIGKQAFLLLELDQISHPSVR